MSNGDSATRQARSTAPLYWAWAFIGLGSIFDFDFEAIRCVNGEPVECSGVDFANLLFGAVSAVILFSNWSSLISSDGSDAGTKWGVRAAAAGCIGLLVTAFDGVGCRCL